MSKLAQGEQALAHTIIGSRVVVVRHVDELNVGSDENDSAISETNLQSPRILDEVRRAILSGHGDVQVGKWMIQVGNVTTFNVHTKVYSSPDYSAITDMLRSIQAEFRSERALTALDHYMQALQASSAQPAYISLLAGFDLTFNYIPLDASIPRSFAHVSDVAQYIGKQLSLHPTSPVIISGGPGSGKSSLLRHLSTHAWHSPQQVDLTERCLPMLVRLRHLARASGVTPEERLWNAVRAGNETLITGEAPAPGFMNDWADKVHAPWLILLDGFDEIPLAARAEVRLWIERLRNVPNVRIVLTTRKLDFVGERLLQADSATQLILEDFTTHQALQLATSILEGKSATFMQELWDAGAQSIVRTPFALTASALLYKKKGSLPTSRAHLIHELVTLITEEAQFAGLSDEIGDVDLVLPLLEQVALAVLMNGDSRSVALEAAKLVIAGEETRHNAHVLELRAERVIDILSRRSGLLQIESGIVGWTHSLFGDFLAARAAARRYSSQSGSGHDLTIQWFDGEHQVVACFLLAIWSDPGAFKIKATPSNATSAVVALLRAYLPENASICNRDRVVDVSRVFKEGARAADQIEREVVEILCSDPDPFMQINLCARVFSTERDIITAVSELATLPRFSPYLRNASRHPVEWARKNRTDLAAAAGLVLGISGNWPTIESLADDRTITVNTLAAAFDIVPNFAPKEVVKDVLLATIAKKSRNGGVIGDKLIDRYLELGGMAKEVSGYRVQLS